MKGKSGTVTHRLSMRDVSFLKPARFQDHLTILEVSRIVHRDISLLRRLEKEGKIPAAQRIQRGKISVRLWSPKQVEEMKLIFSRRKAGRPPIFNG